MAALLIVGSSTMIHADDNYQYFWYDGLYFGTAIYANPNNTALVAIPPDSSYYSTLSGTLTIPDTVRGTVIINGVPTERVCPVTGFFQAAFKDCVNLTAVNLPATLKSVGNSTFEGCTGLTSIDLPNSVSYMGFKAFANCTGITSVTIPEAITTLADDVFTGCPITSLTWNAINCGRGGGWDPTLITELTIGDKVQQIPMSFMHGAQISSVEIPLSVKNIGPWSFQDCKNLTTVTIPDSVTNIGYYAFMGCTNLTTLYWNAIRCESRGGMYTYYLTEAYVGDKVEYIPSDFIRDAKVQTIDLPNSVKDIGEYAFFNCSRLKNIRMPEYLVTIGNWCFSGCDSLAVVDIPNTVTYIGDYAFYFMKMLTSATLPPHVEYVGEAAYMGNRTLTSVGIIPKSLTTIGYLAFSYLPNVESFVVAQDNPVYDSRENCNAIIETATDKLLAGTMNTVIPSSVKTIGTEAFYWSYNLHSIDFPEGLEVIEESAFSDSRLTEIVLPSTLQSIGGWGFCYNYLTDVTSLAITPPTVGNQYTFYPGTKNGAILRVPEEAFEAYKEAEYWKDFMWIIPIGQDFLRGDMDQNGKIDIVDLSMLIDFILKGNANHTFIQNPYADLDNNGSYNIADVSSLIDILLSH